MHIVERAFRAVQKMGGAINGAFEKVLRNEVAEHDRATGGLEGEGSYEGTRRYNSGVKEYVAAGRAPAAAEKARKAFEGAEGSSLREAERTAKRGPRLAIPRPRPRKPASDGRP